MSTSSSWGRTEEQQRYVDEANAADEERRESKKRQERQHLERDAAIDQLRAELRQEVANLRSEMEAQKQLLLDATGQALGELSNKTCDLAERQINDLQRELTTTIARHYGELAGRIDAVLATLPDARPRSKDFKFSNERDDGIVDMPSPLVRKTTFN
jgi:hypothetical protein